MLKPLVSVIVPIYKVEDYLEICVNDLIAQTYQNIEIILIDDGSPDNCGEICDKLALTDSRIVVVHQKNKGLSGARNKGLEIATGEYVTFVDSDDRVDMNMIQHMVDLCLQHNAEIVQCRSFAFTDDAVLPPNGNHNSSRVVSNVEICKMMLTMRYAGISVAQVKLYKASLFDNLKFKEGKLHEDDFIVYLLLWNSKKTVYSEWPLYFYRSKRAGSITHSGFNLRHLDGLKALYERMVFFEEKNQEIYELSAAAYCEAASRYILNLKHDYNGNDSEQIIEEIKNSIKKNIKIVFNGEYLSNKRKIGIFLRVYMPEFWRLILNFRK